MSKVFGERRYSNGRVKERTLKTLILEKKIEKKESGCDKINIRRDWAGGDSERDERKSEEKTV